MDAEYCNKKTIAFLHQETEKTALLPCLAQGLEINVCIYFELKGLTFSFTLSSPYVGVLTRH